MKVSFLNCRHVVVSKFNKMTGDDLHSKIKMKVRSGSDLPLIAQKTPLFSITILPTHYGLVVQNTFLKTHIFLFVFYVYI